MAQDYDLIIVGGGIAGGALATAMASAGKAVLVLEKTTEYKDIVRGELMVPWGVEEVDNLGLRDVLMDAGGHFIAVHADLGDGIVPDEAFAKPVNLALLPDIPGTLAVGHPTACDALGRSAIAAGATVLRGVREVVVTPGSQPSVAYVHEGTARDASARIVIGADGRNSVVRRQLGAELVEETLHHWIVGLLVEDVPEWPDEVQTTGAHGDAMLFVFPQGEGRLRLYVCYAPEQKARFAGSNAERALLATFDVPTMPHGKAISKGTIAGPANAFPSQTALVETIIAPGVALVGDAAGHLDPINGQGLAISLRDVRMVRDALLGSDTWDEGIFEPYVEERRERMRRLSLCARLDGIMKSEFGQRAQRRREAIDARRASERGFLSCQAAVVVGPEKLPAEFFDEGIEAELIAMGAE